MNGRLLRQALTFVVLFSSLTFGALVSAEEDSRSCTAPYKAIGYIEDFPAAEVIADCYASVGADTNPALTCTSMGPTVARSGPNLGPGFLFKAAPACLTLFDEELGTPQPASEYETDECGNVRRNFLPMVC